MSIDFGGGMAVDYFDVNHPEQTFQPQVVNLDAGFRAARNRVQDSAFEQEFEAITPWLGEHVIPLARDPLVNMAQHMAREYRAGKIPRITTEMMMRAAIQRNDSPGDYRQIAPAS